MIESALSPRSSAAAPRSAFRRSPARGPRSARPSAARVGLVSSARAIDSICCSPPESWLPMLSSRSLRFGNSSNTRSCVQWPGRAPTSRFSRTRQRGKDLALLRHEAEAGQRRGDRPARASRSRPSKQHLAGVQRGVAHDGREQRGLADAVAPDHADAFARREREIDVLEHDGLAVAGRDALEREFERAQPWPACPR